MTERERSQTHGMVAAPQAEAAYESARVLDAGGNAADALVTGAFVQGAVDPHRCGIGGFGCATVWFRDPRAAKGRGEPNSAACLAIDFHGRAGSRAREDIWVDRFESAAPDGFGYVLDGKLNDVGYGALTVPGMVAGVAEIHRRFGTLPWRDLVERAVPYARDGFRVPPELAEFWIRPGLYGRVSTRERLGFTEAGRSICFRPDGTTFAAGELFRQPELARTYERIATEGPETFYRGPLAEDIARDWAANDALITADDLATYAPDVHEPVRGTYRGRDIASTPLPGGGVALLQALALIEELDLARLGHNSPDAVDAMGRVLQAVWADRLARQGDPRFTGLEDARFLSNDALDALRGDARSAPPHGSDCSDTTQLSIVDRDGNAISFSHSLGYNSGVFAPGTGILFNNCMSAFDPRPGQSNSIAPGKARSTAVAETLVFDRSVTGDDSPWVTLGSPGAARITAGLTGALTNLIDFGMNIAQAVVEPRFDAYGPGTMLLESRFPPPVTRQIKAQGWSIIQSPKPFGVVGRVYAVECRPDAPGGRIAGVDPGAPGAAFRSIPRESS